MNDEEGICVILLMRGLARKALDSRIPIDDEWERSKSFVLSKERSFSRMRSVKIITITKIELP